MAHERPRHAETLLKKLLGFSPIVGIFGHRQVGKTTLLANHCREYVTLDLRSQLASVELDPERFVAASRHYPFGIDEAQLAPPLFPALKEHVRTHKRPGQFLLSGSVRFTSRKAIRESLTGRIVHLELLPFTQAEMDQRPANPAVLQSLRGEWNTLHRTGSRNAAELMRRYLETGGLPGACFIRSATLRTQRFESQLETILDRDLRLVLETRLSYTTLRNVLLNLALTQGSPLDLTALARKTRVSTPTLRGLLRAFEAIFLIRVLRTEGTEKRPVVFLEDQGEASHLIGQPLDPLTDLSRFLFAQIHSPLRLSEGPVAELFQYRTRGGAHVPLAVRQGSRRLGLIPLLEENPGKQALASAASFLRSYPASRVIFVHLGQQGRVLSGQMATVSAGVFA